MKNRILLLAALLFSLAASAQIKVMSYNILNYPTSDLLGRADTLQNIVDYVQPDLLLIQELKSAWGLEQIRDISFANQAANFESSVFVPQTNGGSNGLQQAIVYNTDKLTLKSQYEVVTGYRDVNEFILYLNDANLPNGADTTFIYVYVTHLKSSQGNENEQIRLQMVEAR